MHDVLGEGDGMGKEVSEMAEEGSHFQSIHGPAGKQQKKILFHPLFPPVL